MDKLSLSQDNVKLKVVIAQIKVCKLEMHTIVKDSEIQAIQAELRMIKQENSRIGAELEKVENYS